MEPTLLSLAADVLRRPLEVVERVAEQPALLPQVLPRLVLLALVGGGVFGAVTGMYRGGPQVLYAAVKMPLLLLIPPMIVLPAARALVALDGPALSGQRLATACLVGMSRTAMLSVALTPPLWLLYRTDLSHQSALAWMLGSLALVGLPGLITVVRAMFPAGSPRGSQLALVALLGLVFAQTGWLLRPFMSMHGTGYPLLCAVDHDIFSGLQVRLLSTREAPTDWDCANPLVLGSHR